jgi:short-subunit dehydrogenase
MANPPAEPRKKTAAVTGAASGIGRAFCLALARRGYDLILIDRSRAAAEELADKVKAEFPGITAEPCVADLTIPEQLEMAATTVRECPSLELLMNGAGFGTCGMFIETEFAAQKRMLDVHVTASVTLCRAALPGMVARDSGGIINIASINAYTRFPETVMYTATKMFLVAFTECIQVELEKMGARNVRVQALCPGQTRTAFTETQEMKGFDPSRVPAFMWMTPDTLVELSLARLARKSGTYIPLLRNKLFCFVFGNRLINELLVFLRKYGVLESILRLFRR